MHTKGFTLVEVLIGLFIAVVAAAYVAQTITSTNKVVAAGRSTFVATNLAHEGLNLTRALRDTTWFADTTPADRTDWMLASGICEDASTHEYVIDPNMVRQFQNSKTKVPQGGEQALLYIQNNTLWAHEVSNTPTLYRRVLQADCKHVSDTPAVVTITSTVSWIGQNGEEKNVSIKEQLYNWFQ